MVDVKLWDLVEWTHGEANFSPEYNPLVENIVTDSRKVVEGAVYVALKGERSDGHSYVSEVFSSGALAALVTEFQGNGPQIKVKNTYLSLGDIARSYLEFFKIHKIALTGSSGKTTTKDMIYACLSANYPTLCNQGNLNTEVGLPLTAFRLTQDIQWGVFEMGMQTLGEIQYLAEIVRPQIALITNIGTAHLEFMKTQENIFKAKMEIATYLQSQDTLVLNADDPFLKKVLENKQSYKTVGYGFDDNAQVRCLDYTVEPKGTWIRAQVFEREIHYEIPLFGKYNILNSLGALAVSYLAGCSIEKSIKGLSRMKLSADRMDIRIQGDKCVINDAYNANAESMKAALEMLGELDKETVIQGYNIPKGENRKVAILGAMGELGESSPEIHRNIGIAAVSFCDVLIAIGAESRYIQEGALTQKSSCQVYYFSTKEEAIDQLSQILKVGDIILLKASRSQQLELLLTAIQ